MKILWIILLGLGAAACAAVLVLQGFGLPPVSAGACVLLRIAGAVCLQWLFLRAFHKKAIQALPILAAALWSVWGFFLYLTSPSWRGATFGGFLSDYASYLLGCGLVWMMAFLIPRIVPRVRKAIRSKIKKNSVKKK